MCLQSHQPVRPCWESEAIWASAEKQWQIIRNIARYRITSLGQNMVDSNFANWGAGFSGCDGGNPRGCYWLCGIEYGSGGDTEQSLVFDDVSTPKYVGAPHRNREKFLTYPYNWRAIKLLAALSGKDPGKYKAFFKEEACFDRDSNYFKLNLFPIGFKNTAHPLWPDWLVRKTGLATRQQYLEWCVSHRFPAIRAWMLDYSPNLIVCTGITAFEQFHAAFGLGNERVVEDVVAAKQVKHFLTNDEKTLVAVVYFLGGAHGLKSDPELTSTGQHLAGLLRKFNSKPA